MLRFALGEAEQTRISLPNGRQSVRKVARKRCGRAPGEQ